MKTFFMIGVFVISVIVRPMAQISINSDGSAPDASAMLDVKSNSHGVLIPRIPASGRDLIPSPATGLLIYNTTSNLFNFFNGSHWCQVEASFVSDVTGVPGSAGGVSISAIPDGLPDISAMLDISDSTRGILIPRTIPASIAGPVPGMIIYNTLTSQVNYYRGGSWSEISAVSTGQPGAPGSQPAMGMAVKSDGSDPDPSAMLDVSAPDRGMLIPRMTSSQRDAIFPATGLVIYSTSSNAIEYFNGTGWYRMNVNFTCGNPLEDARDGQTYNTVQIGTQCWMAESLNYGLLTANNTQMANNGVAEKWCFDNEETKCQEWGALYQWDEAMQYTTVESTQGMCPALWHIPSEAEWDTLEEFLGRYYIAGGKMKEAGFTHWVFPNTGATNSSGFTAIAAGVNDYTNAIPGSGLYTHHYIWASTEAGAAYARRRGLFYFSERSYPYYDHKWLGFSVRCVKD
jgi:uncharacterized protein (TIGR02145 family)